jgi:CO/xanthine dehydrogenase Mo-binding subunit
MNLVKPGSETATGQVLDESVGAREVLESVVRRGRYAEKRKEYARWNRGRKNSTWRGIGVSVCHHGAGFTGSGESFLASRAALALTRKGEIRVLAASTEIGQGTISMFTSLVAQTLGVPEEWVTVERPDTGLVPDSGPTVASRTCMIVGALVERAARRLRERIVESGEPMPSTRASMARLARRLCGREPELRFEEEYVAPPEIQWDEQTYRGDAYPVYGYGATVVDLEVDRATLEVRVRRLTAAVDVGRALSRRLVEGQVMGGVTQALGWALLENTEYRAGMLQNPQLTNYLIPTALDTPPLDVAIVEKPYARGPLGAKGVGELPMDIPAPAVAAAVHDATGLFLTELPILPEKILEALPR